MAAASLTNIHFGMTGEIMLYRTLYHTIPYKIRTIQLRKRRCIMTSTLVKPNRPLYQKMVLEGFLMIAKTVPIRMLTHKMRHRKIPINLHILMDLTVALITTSHGCLLQFQDIGFLLHIWFHFICHHFGRGMDQYQIRSLHRMLDHDNIIITLMTNVN